MTYEDVLKETREQAAKFFGQNTDSGELRNDSKQRLFSNHSENASKYLTPERASQKAADAAGIF